MKANKQDRVGLVLDTDGTQFFWTIQNLDKPEFFFSNSHHWTDDLFEIHAFWYHHQATNMAVRKEFQIDKPAIITFEIVHDQCYISIDDKQIEIVDNITADKYAMDYITKNYAYKFNKEE